MESDIQRYALNQEKKKVNYSFVCQKCKHVYATSKSLQRHLLHNCNGLNFSCTSCGRQFKRESLFKNHCIKGCALSSKIKNALRSIQLNYTDTSTVSRQTKIDNLSMSFLSENKNCNIQTPNNSTTYESGFPLESFILPNKVVLNTPTNIASNILSNNVDYQKRFSCSLCELKYSTQTALTRHQLKHLPDKPFTCSKCSKQFSHPSSYRNHYMRTCPFSALKSAARRTYVHKLEPNLYKSVASTLTPFDVAFQPIQPQEITYIPDNRAKVTVKKPWVCGVCGCNYAFRAGLQRHQLTHLQERPYCCENCNTGFSHPSAFKNHKKICKAYVEATPTTTSVIHTEFKMESLDVTVNTNSNVSLATDIDIKLPISSSWAKADSTEFFSDSNFVDSSLSYFNESKPNIELTPTFLNESSCATSNLCEENISIPELSLSNKQRQWSCNNCNRSYATKTGLVRHQLTHLSEKPFKCIRCGAQFSHPSSYRNHCIRTCGYLPGKISLTPM